MRIQWLFVSALAILGVALPTGRADAQAVQTWVSGSGDDANPCSRTAPCATFAGALALTAVGGEIDALDPGDFGPVTITTALTIDGRMMGSIQPTAVDGITVTSAAGDKVVLRHLAIENGGSGVNGLTFNGAGTLTLDDVSIFGFRTGLEFIPTGVGQLLATDLAIHDNTDAGLVVGSTAGSARAMVTSSHIQTSGTGVKVSSRGSLAVFDTTITGNQTAGVLAVNAAGDTAQVNLEDVDLSQNGIGARATGAVGSAVIRLSQVHATQDGMTTAEDGTGRVLSFGNNRLDIDPSMQFTATPASVMVPAGAVASFTGTVEFTGLHVQPIAFTCTGLPVGVTCVVTPTMLGDGVNTSTAKVRVTTVPPRTTTAFTVPPRLWPIVPIGGLLLLLVSVLGFGSAARTRRRAWSVGLVMIALSLACGDNQKPATTTPGTPAGRYPFTATASAGSVTAAAALTLIVQ